MPHSDVGEVTENIFSRGLYTVHQFTFTSENTAAGSAIKRLLRPIVGHIIWFDINIYQGTRNPDFNVFFYNEDDIDVFLEKGEFLETDNERVYLFADSIGGQTLDIENIGDEVKGSITFYVIEDLHDTPPGFLDRLQRLVNYGENHGELDSANNVIIVPSPNTTRRLIEVGDISVTTVNSASPRLEVLKVSNSVEYMFDVVKTFAQYEPWHNTGAVTLKPGQTIEARLASVPTTEPTWTVRWKDVL